MIYQVPYSQYLSDNKYYGWGAFAHLRAYLHSTSLRWSNGASRNSPVDIWHTKTAALPLAALIPEVWSAGFSGVLIDRTVVKGNEHAEWQSALSRLGDRSPIIDHTLSFYYLPDPGFRIRWDDMFSTPAAVTVLRTREMDRRAFPPWLNGELLVKLAAGNDEPVELSITDHPDLIQASPIHP
jgi:hypothetical protein